MSVLRVLLGRRLGTFEHSEHKLGVWSGVPAIGLDSLASCAYGPEAALYDRWSREVGTPKLFHLEA